MTTLILCTDMCDLCRFEDKFKCWLIDLQQRTGNIVLEQNISVSRIRHQTYKPNCKYSMNFCKELMREIVRCNTILCEIVNQKF